MATQMGSNFRNGVAVGFASLSVLLFCITMLTHSSKYYFRSSSDLAAQHSQSSSAKIPNSRSSQVKYLLAVVVSSVRDRRTLSLTTRDTWARNSYNGRFGHVILTALDSEMSEVPPNVVEVEHDDLPSFVHLSHEELTYVLAKMRELYLGAYRWFLLVPSNTFVSYKHLEALTSGLDPRQVLYIGNPARHADGDQNYCQSGPGILMSYGMLLRMGQAMHKCVLEQSNHTSSDAALGSCVSRLLRVQCSAGGVS